MPYRDQPAAQANSLDANVACCSALQHVILDTSMVVTLADGSQVEACKTCYVPIIICTMSNKPVCYVV